MICVFSLIIMLIAYAFVLVCLIFLMCDMYIRAIVAICVSIVLFVLAVYYAKYERTAIENFMVAFNEINAIFKDDNISLNELFEKRQNFVNALKNLESFSVLSKRQKQVYRMFVFFIDLKCSLIGK